MAKRRPKMPVIFTTIPAHPLPRGADIVVRWRDADGVQREIAGDVDRDGNVRLDPEATCLSR